MRAAAAAAAAAAIATVSEPVQPEKVVKRGRGRGRKQLEEARRAQELLKLEESEDQESAVASEQEEVEEVVDTEAEAVPMFGPNITGEDADITYTTPDIQDKILFEKSRDLAEVKTLQRSMFVDEHEGGLATRLLVLLTVSQSLLFVA